MPILFQFRGISIYIYKSQSLRARYVPYLPAAAATSRHDYPVTA